LKVEIGFVRSRTGFYAQSLDIYTVRLCDSRLVTVSLPKPRPETIHEWMAAHYFDKPWSG